jgi:hypothetical protein
MSIFNVRADAAISPDRVRRRQDLRTLRGSHRGGALSVSAESPTTRPVIATNDPRR